MEISRNGLDAASKDLAQALKLNPELEVAYVDRSVVETNQGKLDQALADENKAIQLKPNDYQAVVNRGAIYVAQGKFDLAEIGQRLLLVVLLCVDHSPIGVGSDAFRVELNPPFSALRGCSRWPGLYEAPDPVRARSTACGSCSMTCSSTRAGPSGTRRCCSQS